MTERFIIDNNIKLDDDRIDTYELSTLVDTQTKNFYFIVDDTANVQSFCDRLNNLNKENEQLKKQLNNFKKRLSALDDAFIDFEQKLYLEVFDIEMDEGTQEAVCEISNLLMQGLCNKDGYGKDEW